MEADVPVRCRCGVLRGVARGVSAGRGNRLVCYCDDCQSFAHFLGRPEEILDANGGTDIFQMSPARFEISEGRDRLACVRLRPGGLMRWYAACCNTPLGNTLANQKLPFVGTIHSCMDHEAGGASRDEALGPSRGGVNVRFAVGDTSGQDARDRPSLGMLLRILGIVLGGRLRGDQKRSPFFDAASGAPSAEPRVLSAEELAAVEAARDGA